MRTGRPNVEDDIKNNLFPDPPVGAHPKFRCETLGGAFAFVWQGVASQLVPQLSMHRCGPQDPRAVHAPLLSSGAGRLLCAGVWMGRAGAVRHYLSHYFLAAGHVDGRAWDDQGCAPRRLCTGSSLAAGADVRVWHRKTAEAVIGGAAHSGGRWWRDLFLAQVYAPAAEARQDPLLAIDYHGRLFQARLAPRCACEEVAGRSVPGSAC